MGGCFFLGGGMIATLKESRRSRPNRCAKNEPVIAPRGNRILPSFLLGFHDSRSRHFVLEKSLSCLFPAPSIELDYSIIGQAIVN